MADVQISVTEADVQIAVIDQENTQLALAAPDDNQVNIAVPGVQGPSGTVNAAADGTVTQPGISFASDTNTGLFRPAADTLGITTGGVERARIDGSGRLLVGTSAVPNLSTAAAPRFPKSTIFNTAGNDERQSLGLYTGSTGTSGPILALTKNKAASTTSTLVTSGDETGSVVFSACDGSGVIAAASIAGFVDGTPGTNDMPGRLVFSTTADGAASSTERMRITSAGNVGIGTTSPAATFSVQSSATQVALLSARAGSGTGGGGQIQTDASGDGLFRLYDSAGVVQVELDTDGGVNYIAKGNVGIGTTSPTEALNVARLGNDLVARFGTLETNAGAWIRLQGKDAAGISNQFWDIRNNVDGSLSFNGNTSTFSERLRIDSSGRLGLGTTSPRSLLSLSSSTGSDITLERSGTTVVAADSYGTISWYGNDATTGASGIRGSIQGLSRGSAGELAITFSTANTSASSTERMRIEADGRVGIGTASPAVQLHAFAADTTNEIRVAAGTPLTHTSTASLSFVTSTSASGVAGTARITGNTPAGGQSELAFLTSPSGNSPTERARVTSDGYLRLASGTGGIQFGGDTAAANALDDYEEGTFTPTIVGTTTAGTGTYSTQIGRYTKIGRLVHCTGTLIWTAHDGTGNMRIEGLPFSSLNVSELFNAAVFAYLINITMPANSILMGDMPNNTSRINLRSVVTGGGTPSVLAMDSTGNIYFSITYQTN